MKELFRKIEDWNKKNIPFAIATVIETWGSSPRPIGSTMLISADMDMAGSVSGGCVENAVVKAAIPLIEKGTAKKLTYGVADEDAWAVGLSCGGKMQVYLEKFLAFDERKEEKEVWEQLHICMKDDKGCVLLTQLVDGPTKHCLILADGTAYGHPISSDLRNEGLNAWQERKSRLSTQGEEQWFIRVFPPKSKLFAIGAAHITADLVDLAHHFGFETIVIDPRGAFAEKTWFQTPPDQLFTKYPSEVLPDFKPDPYSYYVVLSHDPKIDDNALQLILREDVAYIGALGSKKTHAKRMARLEKAGFSTEEINKIHAPIGLNINAKTPREIALAIIAEIVKVKNQYL